MMITCHFKESDWKNANPSCCSSDMSEELISRLEYARALCGFEFRINSAFRSVDYEQSKGRTGSSSHCKGLAVDLACYSNERRYILVQNLLRAGFIRLGIGDTYVHADIDFEKPSCIWIYKD